MSDLPPSLRNIVFISVAVALLFAALVTFVLYRRDRTQHGRRVDHLLPGEILITLEDAWPPRRCQTCWQMFWACGQNDTPFAACAVSADKRSPCRVESGPQGACGPRSINRLPKE